MKYPAKTGTISILSLFIFVLFLAVIMPSTGIAQDSDGNGFPDAMEQELAEKFCPALVLDSRDQGVSPEPVEIMGEIWYSLYITQNNIPGKIYQGEYDSGIIERGNSYDEKEWQFEYFGGPLEHSCGWEEHETWSLPHFDYGGSGCTDELSDHYYDQPYGWYELYTSDGLTPDGDMECSGNNSGCRFQHNYSGKVYPHTVYAHLSKNLTGWYDPPYPEANDIEKYVIQYWFFYPFNNFTNVHEGDWEHINVVLEVQDGDFENAEVDQVVFFFHHWYLVCAYSPNEGPDFDFLLMDDTHPVVFVGGYGNMDDCGCGIYGDGPGSHGSYPIYGRWREIFSGDQYVFGYQVADCAEIDEFVHVDFYNPSLDPENLHQIFIHWREFIDGDPNDNDGVVLLRSPGYYNYDEEPEMSWVKAGIRWGRPWVHSAGCNNTIIQETSNTDNVGNFAPAAPTQQSNWNYIYAGHGTEEYSVSNFMDDKACDTDWLPPVDTTALFIEPEENFTISNGDEIQIKGTTSYFADSVAVEWGYGSSPSEWYSSGVEMLTIYPNSVPFQEEIYAKWSIQGFDPGVYTLRATSYGDTTIYQTRTAHYPASFQYPKAGDKVALSTDLDIEWNMSEGEYVDHSEIWISGDGGNTYSQIGNVPGDSTRYLWEVSGLKSDNCIIKVTTEYQTGEKYDILLSEEFTIYEQKTLWQPAGILINETGNTGTGCMDAAVLDDGSSVVIWTDKYNNVQKVHAQRFDSNGNEVWPNGGVILAEDESQSSDPYKLLGIVRSDYDKVIAVWETYRYSDSYISPYTTALKLDGSGNSIWESNFGFPLELDGEATWKTSPNIIPDGSGGMIMICIFSSWADMDCGAIRIDSNGNYVWENGIKVAEDWETNYEVSALIPNGSHGAIVGWHKKNSPDDSCAPFRIQWIESDGNLPWGDPLELVNGDVCKMDMVYVDQGVVMVWRGTSWQLYAQKIGTDGSRMWDGDINTGGMQDVQLNNIFANPYYPQVIKDHNDNLIFTWLAWDNNSDYNPNYNIYAQKLDPSGATLWGSSEVAVCTDGNPEHFYSGFCADNSGGALIAWTDQLSGNGDIYFQKIDSGGILAWDEERPVATSRGTDTKPSLYNCGDGRCIMLWENETDDFSSAFIQKIGEPDPVPPEPDRDPDPFQEITSIPRDNYIRDPYPNPFNPQTSFQFGLREPAAVTIKIFDVQGRVVKTLHHNYPMDGGHYRISWSGVNDGGNRVSSGVYFLKLNTSKGYSVTKKMILIQ